MPMPYLQTHHRHTERNSVKGVTEMKIIITIQPNVKQCLDNLTQITQQSQGRVISELITNFDQAYLKILVARIERANTKKGFTYPIMEE